LAVCDYSMDSSAPLCQVGFMRGYEDYKNKAGGGPDGEKVEGEGFNREER